MNKLYFQTARRAGFLAAALLVATCTAPAADEPSPAVPPSPAAPVAASVVVPEANPPGGRGNRGNNNNNLQRGNFGGGPGFNVDDKQRELLQESRQANNDDIRKLNEKLAEAQKEYVKAVVAEKYDEKTVREKADAIGKIQADILALNGKSFAVVSPTLKPEQREALEGNVRIGIVIISPTMGFAGALGGNFAAGAAGATFGTGGRGNFGGGDPNNPAGGGGRRGGGPGGPGGIDGGNGGPGGNNTDQPRRRGGGGGNGGPAPGQ